MGQMFINIHLTRNFFTILLTICGRQVDTILINYLLQDYILSQRIILQRTMKSSACRSIYLHFRLSMIQDQRLETYSIFPALKYAQKTAIHHGIYGIILKKIIPGKLVYKYLVVRIKECNAICSSEILLSSILYQILFTRTLFSFR